MPTPPEYTQDFKDKLAEMAEGGRSFLSLETEFGPTRQAIRKWHTKWKRRQEPNEVIAQHTTPAIPAKSQTVLVIPDLHCPFEHPDALSFLKLVRDTYRPTMVVCLGDEADMHSFSRYIPDPDGMSPGKELEKTINSLTPFYIEFPHVLVCESNHTVRPLKKMFDSGLPAAFLPTYSKMLNAPDGWRWERRHVIDGVLYIHGDNGKSGQYAAVNYMKQAKQPVVIGHIHAYGSVFYEGRHFAMNTGCLIDKEAYAFKYAKGALLDVSLGCGIVVNGTHAHFIPMITDANNRWIGKL